jgi:hypothetical protein
MQACAVPAGRRRAAGAWQPFTGGGLARFADAGMARTLAFVLTFALATGLTLGWTLHAAWWPVVDRAILELPEEGPTLGRGRLDWPGVTAGILADSPHLGIAVRMDERSPLGRTADLQVELLPGALRVAGIAGFIEWPWPAHWELSLGRLEARAAWEAWRRPVLATAVGAVTALLASAWCLIALALAVPIRATAFLLRRRTGLGGCLRLAAAALSGASPVLGLGMAGYALRWLPWPALAVVTGAHLLVACLQLLWGLLSRPGNDDGPGRPVNPFGADAAARKRRNRRGNPFGGGGLSGPGD